MSKQDKSFKAIIHSVRLFVASIILFMTVMVLCGSVFIAVLAKYKYIKPISLEMEKEEILTIAEAYREARELDAISNRNLKDGQ